MHKARSVVVAAQKQWTGSARRAILHPGGVVRVRAYVYTSAAVKRVFPSHSTPLSQPRAHAAVLFNEGFSAARARDPAVFPSNAPSINITLFLSLLPPPCSPHLHLQLDTRSAN